MTQQEYENTLTIIRKYMRLDYMANGCPRIILDNNGVALIERELKEMVKNG